MSIAEELRRNLRTISARGVEFSEWEMRSMRILKIINCYGRVDEIGVNIDNTMELDYVPGEFRVAESSIRERYGIKMGIVSVIVFADEFSWQMFAMKYWKIYSKEKERLLTLLN